MICWFGLEIMDDGARKNRLHAMFEAVLSDDLSGRVLVFDKPAAEEAAQLSADKRKQGQTLEVRDAMICGIARAARECGNSKRQAFRGCRCHCN